MTESSSKVLPLEQRWRLFLNRGSRSLRAGDYQRATEAFERAYTDAPEEPQVMLAVGREYVRMGRYEEAEPLLRGAWSRLQESTAAAVTLARLLGIHLGRREEAFEVIHRSLERCADRAPLQIIQGELLLEEGAYSEARTAFAQIEPGSGNETIQEAAQAGLARTFNAEGIALSEQGAFEQAIFAFKRAADLEPGWAGPFVNLGVVFGRMGKTSTAMEAYQNALEREPENPVAYFNLGTAQHKVGRRTEAVRTLEELLQLTPDYPHVRGALANVLGELKEFDRAIALLLEELEIDATCVSCWTSLGLAYICSGNAERGESCLQRALELDPNYFNAIHNLASLYVTQHRYEDAERILRRAHQLDPERTSELLATDRQLAALRELDRFRFLE
jgi:tetratricopeptide (TPR) repeat protein